MHHVDLSDKNYLSDCFFSFLVKINQINALFFASVFVTIRSVESLDYPCVNFPVVSFVVD